MAYSRDQYRDQLHALLPPGRAFPQDPGTTLDALLDAMAAELARVDGRGDDLLREAIPVTTSEMLTDWERVAGLPDNCSGLLPPTMQARRADLISKLTATGGQSPAYFIAVARALGFDVRITEFRPFRAGETPVGGALTNGDWAYTWRVKGPETSVQVFRVGLSAAGEPLAWWGNSSLECRLRKIKPAHTILQFAYDQALLTIEGTNVVTTTGDAVILEE